MLLVSGLEIRVHGFNPKPINVGFVVDQVALIQGFLRLHEISPISIIPLKLHNTIIHL
jgi:hypothetical protein